MKRYLILILSLGALISCKKTESFHVIGNVKHIYTQQNISGTSLSIFWTDNYFLNLASDPVATTFTDNDGNFSFSFDIKYNKNDDLRFLIAIPPPTTYDSTAIQCKFLSETLEFEESEINNSQNFQLKPSGLILAFVTDSTWDSINADSIAILTPYVTEYLIKNITPNNRLELFVEPSEINTLSWFYIKNGVQGPTITKDIFVPNMWMYYFTIDDDNFYYEIKF